MQRTCYYYTSFKSILVLINFFSLVFSVSRNYQSKLHKISQNIRNNKHKIIYRRGNKEIALYFVKKFKKKIEKEMEDILRKIVTSYYNTC